MEWYISANFKMSDFTGTLTLEDKIAIFEDRVTNWQFGVAMALEDKDVPHRHPAMLQILMSYFEMVGKYRSGYCVDDRSEFYFREGLKCVLPEVLDLPQASLESLEVALYGRVRCGLYHMGLLGPDTVIYDLLKKPVGIGSAGQVLINPWLLAGRLKAHFVQYMADLRDPSNAELQHSFEARFDHDN